MMFEIKQAVTSALFNILSEMILIKTLLTRFTLKPVVFHSLHLQTYYHGEPLKANVEITNSSSRKIKDISLSGGSLHIQHLHTSVHLHTLTYTSIPACTCTHLSKHFIAICFPPPVFSAVEQVTNVVLYSNDKYIKSVAKEETE